MRLVTLVQHIYVDGTLLAMMFFTEVIASDSKCQDLRTEKSNRFIAGQVFRRNHIRSEQRFFPYDIG